MNKFYWTLLFTPLFALAQNLSQSFPAGRGAIYKIKMKNSSEPIHLNLYVAGTRVDSVHIEYFLESRGLFPIQLWQQFEIAVTEKGPTQIRKGYILAKELKAPEIIPEKYLSGASGGIQVNDFVFVDKTRLEKLRIGVETVEIAAGTTKATHYRTTSNGQTVDFWISDDAKPVGLVLLTSKSEVNMDQNYTLELDSMVENVRPKILPENAIPLSKDGESYLAKPSSLR